MTSINVGSVMGKIKQLISPATGEPTFSSTGPRVSLAGAGATLTPTWLGTETVINPGDDWASKISGAAAGTVFRVKTGVHRRTAVNLNPPSRLTFIGEPGAIVSGFVDVGNTGWTQTGNVWSKSNAAWPVSTDGGVGPGAFDAGWEASRQREDMVIDKKPLQRLGSGGTAGVTSFTTTPGAGQWSYDSATKTIYLGSDPTGKLVEVSFDLGGGNRFASTGTGERIVFKNLIVEGYPTANQTAAIECLDAGGGGTTSTSYPMNTVANGYDYLGATPEGGSSATLGGWLLDHVTVRLCHSVGVFLGPGSVAQDCLFTLNGQVNAKASGRNAKYLRCVITEANWSHYDTFVEAGGIKTWNTTNFLVQDCDISSNRGFGSWTDYTWDGHLYEYCQFKQNFGSAVSSEMTEGCEIRYCRILENGVGTYERSRSDPDYAANYCSGQIWGYNSHNYNCHHNYLDTGALGWGGFFLQEQDRGGVSPLSQGTGAGAPSGPRAGKRATCAGSSFQYNSVIVRGPRQGNAFGWRGIVTKDYPDYGNITIPRAAGWLLRTSADAEVSDIPYSLTIDNNWYHLPISHITPNDHTKLESPGSVNYAWFPFRWDGQWGTDVLQGSSPSYAGTNLYAVIDAGRRFGNFAQWKTALAPAGNGAGGFGVDAASVVSYDQ